MILYTSVAIVIGIAVWAADFFLSSLSHASYAAIAFIIPFLIGVAYAVWIKRPYRLIMYLSIITLIVNHLFVVVRVTVVFANDPNLLTHLVGTLKSYSYVFPLEICAAVLGCIVGKKWGQALKWE